MSTKILDEKKKQALLVRDQVTLIIRNYGLKPEEVAKASKDISDVILTAWDLKLSNMDYEGTWFDEQNLIAELKIEAKFKSDIEFLDSLTADKYASFAAWFAELNKANTNARIFYANQPLEEATGVECWFGYFKENLTPQEALDADFANAD